MAKKRGRAPGPPVQPGSFRTTHATAELIRDLDVRDGWLLTIDGVPHSFVDLDDPTHLQFEYVAWIADVLDALAPEGDPLDTAHLGGGAGTVARYVAAVRPASRQVVFEYDQALVELVRTRLAFPSTPKLRMRAVEARLGLGRLGAGTFDVVVRDAFAGALVPRHLCTAEFAADVARVLRPGGVYVLNLADQGDLPLVRDEAATLRAVFAHVVLITEPSVLRGRRYGNVLLLAAHDPLPLDAIARRVARGAVAGRLRDEGEVADLVGRRAPLHDLEPWAPAGSEPPPAVEEPPARGPGWSFGDAEQHAPVPPADGTGA